jgi:hypothetical protein
MTRILTTTAILGVAAAFAQPAAAMTCEEFMELEEVEQVEVIEEMGGRGEMRDEARGDDEMADADDIEAEMEEEHVEGGREEQREEGRGDDPDMAQIIKACEEDPEADLENVMHPAAPQEN